MNRSMPTFLTCCSVCRRKLTLVNGTVFRRALQNHATASSFTVTLENIYSAANKKQFQAKLSNSDVVKDLFPPDSNKEVASVLIPLCTVNQQPSCLFTLRSENMRSNRRQVSFPGGKTDPGDHDVVHTALREMNEEIGIPENNVDIWGLLNPGYSVSAQTKVVPVIGFIGEINVDKLMPNQDEVEQVFTRSIASLCQNIRQTQFRAESSSVKLTRKGFVMPVFLGEDCNIWGLTAMFLHQTLTLIAPGIYNFKLRYVS